MSDGDSGVRKARAQAETAERDLKSTERAAAIARERAQRAKLALKKAKKQSKKAAKAARKARKAAEAARKAFTKATARATKAEAQAPPTRKATTTPVTVVAATATKPAPKKTVSTKGVEAGGTRKKTVSQKQARRVVIARAAKRPRRPSPASAPATEPAISTVEPLGEPETFVLGEPTFN